MKDFTVFVLDDDKYFCLLMSCLMKQKGLVFGVDGYKINLMVFSDMETLDEAMRIIRETKPDLVILDYYLGAQGCKASLDILEKTIQCCAFDTDIHIISGLFPEDIRFVLAKRELQKTDIGITLKPFSIEDLMQIIKTSVNRKENVQYKRDAF